MQTPPPPAPPAYDPNRFFTQQINYSCATPYTCSISWLPLELPGLDHYEICEYLDSNAANKVGACVNTNLLTRTNVAVNHYYTIKAVLVNGAFTTTSAAIGPIKASYTFPTPDSLVPQNVTTNCTDQFVCTVSWVAPVSTDPNLYYALYEFDNLHNLIHTYESILTNSKDGIGAEHNVQVVAHAWGITSSNMSSSTFQNTNYSPDPNSFAPQNLTGSCPTPYTCSISWSPVTTTGFDHYQVCEYTDNTLNTPVGSCSNTMDISRSTVTANHYFTVKAVLIYELNSWVSNATPGVQAPFSFPSSDSLYPTDVAGTCTTPSNCTITWNGLTTTDPDQYYTVYATAPGAQTPAITLDHITSPRSVSAIPAGYGIVVVTHAWGISSTTPTGGGLIASFNYPTPQSLIPQNVSATWTSPYNCTISWDPVSSNDPGQNYTLKFYDAGNNLVKTIDSVTSPSTSAYCVGKSVSVVEHVWGIASGNDGVTNSYATLPTNTVNPQTLTKWDAASRSEAEANIDFNEDGVMSTTQLIYSIYTSEQWLDFGRNCQHSYVDNFAACNKWFVLANDLDFSLVQITGSSPLWGWASKESGTNRLILPGSGVLPASSGQSSPAFSGIFDGGNFSFKNLYIKMPIMPYQGSDNVGGVFGNTNYATVRNINIDASVSIEAGSNVGGIIGVATATKIQNVTNHANIKAVYLVGGLAGYADGTTILGSTNTGSILGTDTEGGIVGFPSTGASIVGFTSTGVSITNCTNTGSVRGRWNAGGITGNSQGNTVVITNSTNTGAVVNTN